MAAKRAERRKARESSGALEIQSPIKRSRVPLCFSSLLLCVTLLTHSERNRGIQQYFYQCLIANFINVLLMLLLLSPF